MVMEKYLLLPKKLFDDEDNRMIVTLLLFIDLRLGKHAQRLAACFRRFRVEGCDGPMLIMGRWLFQWMGSIVAVV